jgi:hypothetical protein
MVGSFGSLIWVSFKKKTPVDINALEFGEGFNDLP